MRHHLRLMATLAVCVIAYGVLLAAFRLLNAPRNAAVAEGLVLIFILLEIVPVVVSTIWRRL
jgi:heme/copper-type cytochrome/quinol oxidase subunit 4